MHSSDMPGSDVMGLSGFAELRNVGLPHEAVLAVELSAYESFVLLAVLAGLAVVGTAGVVWIVRCLTRRIVAESESLHREYDKTCRALRESEERFDLAIRGTDAGVWDWDLRTNRVVFSPRWKDMLGYREDEIADHYREWESRLHPDDRQRSLDTIRDYLNGTLPQYRLVHRLRHKDGSYRWILSRGAAVDDERGHPYRFVGSHIDITAQMQAQETVLSEQQALRQMLDLHERDRQLIAFEIHDGFVQLAASALYHLQAFRETLARDPGEAWKIFDKAVQLVQQGVDDARRLIGGLRPAVLDESGIVAGIEYLAHEAELRDGLVVEFERAVRFDRLAPHLEVGIFRIVQETLTNAARHSGSKRVRITLMQVANRIRLEVRDWGVGFDPARVDKNRFGLQGIRERARLLDGRVAIESAPGKGTHVVVELPLVERPAEEPHVAVGK